MTRIPRRRMADDVGRSNRRHERVILATQRNSLTDIFASMKVTHRSIRLLVALGDEKPESVDAFVLARLRRGALSTC